MLSMLRDDQFCILFAIGERITLGIGALLLRIVGEYLVTFMIRGISRMRDVLAMDLMHGTAAFRASIVRLPTL